MTKAQLIADLADLPDDADVLVEAVASSNMPEHVRADGTLSTLRDVSIFEQDGPDSPPFAVINHHVEFDAE